MKGALVYGILLFLATSAFADVVVQRMGQGRKLEPDEYVMFDGQYKVVSASEEDTAPIVTGSSLKYTIPGGMVVTPDVAPVRLEKGPGSVPLGGGEVPVGVYPPTTTEIKSLSTEKSHRVVADPPVGNPVTYDIWAVKRIVFKRGEFSKNSNGIGVPRLNNVGSIPLPDDIDAIRCVNMGPKRGVIEWACGADLLEHNLRLAKTTIGFEYAEEDGGNKRIAKAGSAYLIYELGWIMPPADKKTPSPESQFFEALLTILYTVVVYTLSLISFMVRLGVGVLAFMIRSALSTVYTMFAFPFYAIYYTWIVVSTIIGWTIGVVLWAAFAYSIYQIYSQRKRHLNGEAVFLGPLFTILWFFNIPFFQGLPKRKATASPEKKNVEETATTKPVETKPSETKPVEEKPVEPKPAETKAEEVTTCVIDSTPATTMGSATPTPSSSTWLANWARSMSEEAHLCIQAFRGAIEEERNRRSAGISPMRGPCKI